MNAIHIAVKKILMGDVVAFPTETVYGLGADCTNTDAVEKIFAIKGRPAFNPLIIHVADLNLAQQYAEFNKVALALAKAFWPGPMTLVLPLKSNAGISSRVTAGLSTIAIRCPKHPVALELLKAYPHPIAAPSANKSGYVSPTKYDHVYEEFSGSFFIVPGDQSCVGLESTIVDCSEEAIAILRPGAITKEEIENVINLPVLHLGQNSKIKAPGQLEHHYSPRLPIRLNSNDVQPNEALLNFGHNTLNAKVTLNLSPSGDLNEAAANLFDYLRCLDKLTPNTQQIAVAPIPHNGIGIAINERLQRAAAPKSIIE